MPEATKNHCGACAMMLYEDTDGCGYCAMKDLYTGVYCGDPACENFVPGNKPEQ